MMIIFLRVNKVEFYSNMLQRNYCNDFEQVYIWWELDVIEIIGNYFNVLFICLVDIMCLVDIVSCFVIKIWVL